MPYNEEAWQKHNASHQLQLKDSFSPKDVLTISPRQLSESDYADFINFLKQFKHIHVVGAKEIMAVGYEGINKRSAIEFILNLEHIPTNHVCVIGDSENDVSMFEIPGVYSITYAAARPCLMPIASDIVNAPVSEFIATGIDDFVKHLKEIEHN
ncbi:HAD hydrolase family protein [bacterium]|nr:HAD hydrolase family protein [bacterium]